MKKYLFLGLFFMFVYSHTASAQDTTIARAPYWFSLGQMGQVAFLYGFYDGLSLGSGLAIGQFDPQGDCYKKGYAGFSSISLLEKVRLMDIQDEINRIYEDTLNKYLTIPHAFWLSVNNLSKIDSVKINKMYNSYRIEDSLEPKIQKKVKKQKKNK